MVLCLLLCMSCQSSLSVQSSPCGKISMSQSIQMTDRDGWHCLPDANTSYPYCLQVLRDMWQEQYT